MYDAAEPQLLGSVAIEADPANFRTKILGMATKRPEASLFHTLAGYF